MIKLAVVLGIFLALSSCNQNKKLEEDLGPQVSADSFEKAAVEAWGDDNIFSIKKDDYAYVSKSVSINNLGMKPTLGKAMSVTNIVDEGEVVKHHVVIQSEEIQGEGQPSKMSTRERVLAVKKASTAAQNLKQQDVEDEIQMTPFEGFLDVLSICRNKSVECFKLKVENFNEEIPLEMQGENKCRFFTGCKWSGKKVSFVIRVSFTENGSSEVQKQVNIISFKIVNDMPYLFKMVEYCFDGLSEYQGQKFPVKICTQVKDAIKGQ